MKLFFFTGKESLDEASQKRRELAKKHHPDRYPDDKKEAQNKIMSQINSEYEFVISTKDHTAKNVREESQPFYTNEELVIQIFSCLVTKPIDVLKLVKLFNCVKDWNLLLQTFYSKYGKTLAMIIAENVKDKYLRENLQSNIKTIQKINTIGKNITTILNKLFN